LERESTAESLEASTSICFSLEDIFWSNHIVFSHILEHAKIDTCRGENFLFELPDFSGTELECSVCREEGDYVGGVVINIDDLVPPKDER
jgi:hypothetical protein